MSGFLFNRRAFSEERNAAAPPQQSALPSQSAVLQTQAITASAIFAMLVSKGVLSADEAAEFMHEIGLVLERDVEGPLGATAGKLLRSYGQALIAADA